jgi:hypothetical protein
MQTTLQRRTGAALSPPTEAILDLVVINAGDLIWVSDRVRLLREIQRLAQCTTRTLPTMRGIWLLVMTHSHEECVIAYRLAQALTRWCQGVRVVKELDPENTARAAMAFHQLHFPDVGLDQRPSRILVLE